MAIEHVIKGGASSDGLLKHSWPLLVRRLDVTRATLHAQPIGNTADHAVLITFFLSFRGDRAEDHMQVDAHGFGKAAFENVNDR